MKTISILVPTYNEQDNVELVYDRVTEVMTKQLPNYAYELVFIDNGSEDRTRELIRGLCAKDKRVKAIFNARNFGYSRSHFYGLTQMTGDAVMLVHADLQNPPELIPEFVKKWEQGAKVIIGIKNKSKENGFVYFVRGIYYKMMKAMSEVEQIEHFTDFELLDQSFIEVLRKIDDPVPYLRGIVSELGFKMERVYYTQNKREHGKSYANFFKMYDFAMLGITAYSKTLLRMATFVGGGLAGISILVAIITFIRKLLDWNSFSLGAAATTIGVFFLGAVQLFFIGILGEYVLSINSRVIKRPLVIEESRINFDTDVEENEQE
ncbi:MAG: glycosyltransferase family 2 protein [Dysosmobacter sp.]|jgi:glycosyltransferase involved in cell wall biosynthesis|uniref:glycosyltransferase family 2 protein n=1 Tax=Dysosmobacter sp. TaxID=2591382 RepID=UPI003D8F1A9C